MVDSIPTNLWAMLGHVVIKVHFLPVEFHWVKAGINLYQQMSCHKRFTQICFLDSATTKVQDHNGAK